jgi:hypothetical protein
MKTLLFILLLTTHLNAKPLEQMDQRIKVYNETAAMKCEHEETADHDGGLFVDVSCEFQCKGQVSKMERIRGAFIPKNLGLFPGNGSNETNVLWSSLGVSLKSWSQRICLEKAAEGCKGFQLVESSEMKELESGAWKLARFPGCKEKSLTLSPFNDSAKSNRIPSIAGMLVPEVQVANQKNFDLSLSGLKINLPYAAFNGEKTPCQKPIKAKLCFGDCVDLNALSSPEFSETLGTPEPLGHDTIEICGDELAAKLSNQNQTASVKQQICEAYFWESLVKSPSMIRSCAALRGEVVCEGL